MAFGPVEQWLIENRPIAVDEPFRGLDRWIISEQSRLATVATDDRRPVQETSRNAREIIHQAGSLGGTRTARTAGKVAKRSRQRTSKQTRGFAETSNENLTTIGAEFHLEIVKPGWIGLTTDSVGTSSSTPHPGPPHKGGGRQTQSDFRLFWCPPPLWGRVRVGGRMVLPENRITPQDQTLAQSFQSSSAKPNERVIPAPPGAVTIFASGWGSAVKINRLGCLA